MIIGTILPIEKLFIKLILKNKIHSKTNIFLDILRIYINNILVKKNIIKIKINSEYDWVVFIDD